MSQTRQIRRPALKLVSTAVDADANKDSRITHDARGTAVWLGEPAALDLSSLALAVESPVSPGIEGDPYNRPATAFGRPTPASKASSVKRRR